MLSAYKNTAYVLLGGALCKAWQLIFSCFLCVPLSSDVCFDTYIQELLDDVDLYLTFPKPRGKNNARTRNRLSSKITASFEHLSRKGRVDIISQIIRKFASVKDSSEPVAYSTWFIIMLSNISSKDIHTLYQNYPDIFEVLLDDKNVSESDIQWVARKLGKCCFRYEYMSFKDMVFMRKGFIESIEDYYIITSENYPTQLLFDGKTVKIELDYPEVNDTRTKSESLTIGTSLHLLTTKRTENLSSIRVASFKINGIELIHDIRWWNFDDSPRIGYNIAGETSKNELNMYKSHLQEHGIQTVDKIELLLVCKDNQQQILESLPLIIIEYDEQTGEYNVLSEA